MRRYTSLANNIVLSNFRRLPFPYKLTFAVTYKCNYKCKTCGIWSKEPENELNLDEIKEFFRKSNKFNWIDLTGGEIWLRPDIINIVEVIFNECRDLVMFHFPTNGFMTERIVEGVKFITKLPKRPPKIAISCSMDGDEKINDYIRGVKGGWKRQIDTYKQLHAIQGVQVFLGMTLSSFNPGEYDKAFNAAKKECPWLKPTDFHMNVAHESSHYYGNEDIGVRQQDTDQLVEQVERYRTLRGRPLSPIAFLEWRYLKNVEKYLRTAKTPMRCHALHSSCFLNPSGDIFPCAMYEAKVANLRDNNFQMRDIWDKDITKKLQQEIWHYKCPQCWTPCEAYQSIFGNLLGMRNSP